MAYREEGNTALRRGRYLEIQVELAQLAAQRMTEASLVRREAALRERIERVKRSLTHAREGRTKRRSAVVLSTIVGAGLATMAFTQWFAAPSERAHRSDADAHVTKLAGPLAEQLAANHAIQNR